MTALAVWWRILTGGSLNPLARIHLGPDTMLWPPAVLIVVLIAVVMLLPMVGQGRSPHLTGAAHLHRPLVEALRDAPWPARS